MYTPKLTKHVLFYFNITVPLVLYILEQICAGLEGFGICWFFYWKKEELNLKKHFARRTTFSEPDVDEMQATAFVC